MTARERILLYIVGAMALGGIGYVAYTMFVKPIRDHNAQIAQLKDQIDDKQIQLMRDNFENQRLQRVAPFTLPANRELAESEYEMLLGRLMRESKITGGKYAKQTQSETDPEPELVPGTAGKAGRKAYQKVIYSINFEKVNLLKVTDFLTRYYKVPLLHQIVKCSIKHATTGGGGAALKLHEDERNDLTVSLVSEVVLLDGAPERKTLFAVPDEFGAALGGVGLNALRENTEKARNLTPTPTADAGYFALAEMKREYDLIAARDPFHGPLPEYPPPVVKGPKIDDADTTSPRPFDSSPYVYMQSLVIASEGTKLTGFADLRDRHYDLYYTIDFEQTGDLFEIKVQRFTKEVKTDSKAGTKTSELKRDMAHPRTGAILEISDRATKEVRTFKVYGVNGGALILGEKEKVEAPKEDKGKTGGRPKGGGKAPPANLPKPDPKMAAVGGVVALKPSAETYFAWDVGVPLSLARKLNPEEAKAVLAKTARGLQDLAPVVIRELAPLPRRPLN